MQRFFWSNDPILVPHKVLQHVFTGSRKRFSTFIFRNVVLYMLSNTLVFQLASSTPRRLLIFVDPVIVLFIFTAAYRLIELTRSLIPFDFCLCFDDYYWQSQQRNLANILYASMRKYCTYRFKRRSKVRHFF